MSVRGRRVRVPRVSRTFRNKHSLLAHNPIKYTEEFRSWNSWSAAECDWIEIPIGQTTSYDRLFNMGLQNYYGVGQPIYGSNNNAVIQNLKFRADKLAHRVMFMNTCNGRINVHVYRLYPKVDITTEDLYPKAIMQADNAVGAVNTNMEIQTTASDGSIAYDDYRFKLSDAKTLGSVYRVKYIKKIQVQPGGRFVLNYSMSATVSRKTVVTDPAVDGYTLMTKGKGYFTVLKCTGDWGVHSSVQGDQQLRMTEGSLAYMMNIYQRGHMLQDNRLIANNQFYTGESTGASTVMNQPEVQSTVVGWPGK